VWIVDSRKEHLAGVEARTLHIPSRGGLDSNCDPDQVDFPIPGNDDAIRAVGLLTRVVADAVADGLMARSGAKTGDGDAAAIGAEEPLAEWERELLQGDADQAAVAATGGDTAARTATEPAGVVPAAEATGASSEGAESQPAAEVPTDAAVTATSEAPSESAVDAPSEVTAPAEAAADEPGTPA
jgi:small subunit ribosomal protein S2